MNKVLFGRKMGSIRHQEGTQRWILPKSPSNGGVAMEWHFWRVINRTKYIVALVHGTVDTYRAEHFFKLGCSELTRTLSTPFKINGGGDSDCQSWTLVMEMVAKSDRRACFPPPTIPSNVFAMLLQARKSKYIFISGVCAWFRAMVQKLARRKHEKNSRLWYIEMGQVFFYRLYSRMGAIISRSITHEPKEYLWKGFYIHWWNFNVHRMKACWSSRFFFGEANGYKWA